MHTDMEMCVATGGRPHPRLSALLTVSRTPRFPPGWRHDQSVRYRPWRLLCGFRAIPYTRSDRIRTPIPTFSYTRLGARRARWRASSVVIFILDA